MEFFTLEMELLEQNFGNQQIPRHVISTSYMNCDRRLQGTISSLVRAEELFVPEGNVDFFAFSPEGQFSR